MKTTQHLNANLYCDVLRRSATTEARHFGDFRKLRSVCIEGGEIRGEWPATTDDSGYWNPFAAYYKNQTPAYMAFAKCKTDDPGVKRFVENYGPIGEDLSRDSRKGVFSIATFKMEQWRFNFALTLYGTLRKHDLLRSVLRNALEDGWSSVERTQHEDRQRERAGQSGAVLRRFPESARRWYEIVQLFCSGATDLELDPKLDKAGNLNKRPQQAGRKHLEALSAEKLISRAGRHLQTVFLEKLKPVHLCLDFPDGEAPRLIAECDDLLAAFYFMLAKDSDAGRAPLVCANCKKFFFSKHKAAVYCEEPECRKHGRARQYWERCKAKINRKRKAKYRRERRALARRKKRRAVKRA